MALPEVLPFLFSYLLLMLLLCSTGIPKLFLIPLICLTAVFFRLLLQYYLHYVCCADLIVNCCLCSWTNESSVWWALSCLNALLLILIALLQLSFHHGTLFTFTSCTLQNSFFCCLYNGCNLLLASSISVKFSPISSAHLTSLSTWNASQSALSNFHLGTHSLILM